MNTKVQSSPVMSPSRDAVHTVELSGDINRLAATFVLAQSIQANKLEMLSADAAIDLFEASRNQNPRTSIQSNDPSIQKLLNRYGYDLEKKYPRELLELAATTVEHKEHHKGIGKKMTQSLSNIGKMLGIKSKTTISYNHLIDREVDV